MIAHQRDNEHLSREARAMGMVVWDVIQSEEGVSILPSQAEADACRTAQPEASVQG